MNGVEQLFLVTVGPVQDFINSARRSRDLWFGSWLLSELSAAAARCLKAQPGATLIFPHPAAVPYDGEPLLDTGGTEARNVANRIIAKLPGDRSSDDVGAQV